jgi:large-conductance mechanosensitive channel
MQPTGGAAAPAKKKEEKSPSASPAFALSNNFDLPTSGGGSMFEMCKASCINHSEIILAVILFIVIILLCFIIVRMVDKVSLKQV